MFKRVKVIFDLSIALTRLNMKLFVVFGVILSDRAFRNPYPYIAAIAYHPALYGPGCCFGSLMACFGLNLQAYCQVEVRDIVLQ